MELIWERGNMGRICEGGMERNCGQNVLYERRLYLKKTGKLTIAIDGSYGGNFFLVNSGFKRHRHDNKEFEARLGSLHNKTLSQNNHNDSL